MLEQCLSAFRDREVACFDGLLYSVNGSLSALGDAMAGRLPISDSLEETWAALHAGRVPQVWQAMAYPSCRSLYSWIEDLQCRVNWLWSWADQSELPHCFWLTYFVSPQGFLTTVLQAHARMTGIALDTLHFSHEVRSALGDASEVKSSAARGVYTYGIYLQGARWDVHSHQVEDLRPGIHVSRIPVLHLIPIARVAPPTGPASALAEGSRGKSRGSRALARHSMISGLKFGTSPGYPEGAMERQESSGTQSSAGASPRSPRYSLFSRQCSPADSASTRNSGHASRLSLAGERYECPLYRTSFHGGTILSTGKSTNEVCSVLLPTAAHPSRWILRGVFLVCEPPE